MRTPSAYVPALTLSGGNQQKLIVGREMTAEPKVLIASHPTRGIDVGAQAAIWDVIRAARAAGLGVLLISADLEELIGLSDTLHVMYRGKLAATLDPADGDAADPRFVHDRGRGTRMNRVSSIAKRVLTRLGPNVLAPLIAGAVAIVVSSIALLLSGNSPSEAFTEMWKVLDSTESVVGIINKAGWYYVAGVAVAIGFKMGLFNIGADGQYRLGALFAAYLGAKADLPAVLHVPYIILIGVLVGAAWAAIPGILKVTRGVNEVISTIMLNFVATGLIGWLLNTYWRNPSPDSSPRRSSIPPQRTHPVAQHARRGRSASTSATTSCCRDISCVAILVGVGYYVLAVPQPVRVRAAGFGRRTRRRHGRRVSTPSGWCSSRSCCRVPSPGWSGWGRCWPTRSIHKYGDQFPLDARPAPGCRSPCSGATTRWASHSAAIVWAAIERGTQPLSIIGIPQEIGVILQGSFLLSAVIVFEIFSRRAQEQAIRDAAARAAPRSDRGTGVSLDAENTGTTVASTELVARPQWYAGRNLVILLALGGIVVDVGRPVDRRRRPSDVVGHGRARPAAGDPDRARRHRRPLRRAIGHHQHRPRRHVDHGHDHGGLCRLALGAGGRHDRRRRRRAAGRPAPRPRHRHVRRQPHRAGVRDQHHRSGRRPLPRQRVVHHRRGEGRRRFGQQQPARSTRQFPKVSLPVLSNGPDLLGDLEKKGWFVLSDVAGILRGLTVDVRIDTIIAILLVIGTAYLVWRTPFGLRLRAAGEKPGAADSLGVSVIKMRYYGMMLSGAMAGVGGAVFVFAGANRYQQGQTQGQGFLGLAALVFGNWKPAGVLAGAGVFGYASGIENSLDSGITVKALILAVAIALGLYVVWSAVRRQFVAASITAVVAVLLFVVYAVVDEINEKFVSTTPYVVTLVVVTLFAQRLRPPAAAGIPYHKGDQL